MFVAMIIPLGSGQVDNSLPGVPVYPSQGLPGSQPLPGQPLPGSQPLPGQPLPIGGGGGQVGNQLPQPQHGFILVYSPVYGWIYIPAHGNRPDNSLPGSQPLPGHELPGSQPLPGNELPRPPSGNRPDQSLPGAQPLPGNELPKPPTAQPKG